MAFTDLEGLRCYYRLEGREDRPVLALSHSLGIDHSMWDPQAPDLLEYYRLLRYDIRGHGATDAPAGDYSIERLASDAIGLLDHLGLDRVAWVGQSLGGLVGQAMAARAPDRLTHLVLATTTPRIADPAAMESRRHTVLAGGMTAVLDTAMARYFTPALIAAGPPRVASARQTLLRTAPAGYAGCCAALRDADLTPLLATISTPTLVISGDADTSMPWDGHGSVLAGRIPGARGVRLPTAHLANLGLPRTFTRTVLEFLAPPGADAYERGLDIRRAILGDEHVDQALTSATNLTSAFQRLITQYVWGEVWTRPGMAPPMRRLLALATTAALGRWEEFRLHLSKGLDRGLEWADIEEVLLQTAVYAGVPAANTAFRIASEEQARRTPDPASKPAP